MRTNDVKKGARVRLHDGRVMEVTDGTRQNVRGVRGPSPIPRPQRCSRETPTSGRGRRRSYLTAPDGSWEAIELTGSQRAAQGLARALRRR